MIDSSILGFHKVHQKHPENLFLFGTEVLRSAMTLNYETRVSVMAELLLRAFMNSSHDLKELEIIRQELSEDVLSDFLSFFISPHISPEVLDRDLWNPKDAFSSSCLAAVRKRLKLLLQADGLIPVYLGKNAFLIPFHFEKDGIPGVFDFQGNEIEEWSAYARQLEIPCPAVIHCSCVSGIKTSDFTGNSLMLPLQMAWWRKTGELPQYNVFRLIATGAFDSNHRLLRVETALKANLISTRFPEARLICPESDTEKLSGPVVALPQGMKMEDILERMRREAEKMERFDIPYAIRRLDPMRSEVRLTNYKNWDELLIRLKNAAIFDKDNPADAENYLLSLMLQAEANCHGGNTRESMRLNAKALDYARKHGDRFLILALRLLIEKMVLSLDMEQFDEVLRIGEEIRTQIDSIQDLVTRMDLNMRYHGTLGQAYGCGVLCRLPDITSRQALEHLQMALECAETMGILDEIAHDQNNIHLHYALFASGTEEESEAYDQAYNTYRKLYDASPDAAMKNLFYLKRSQAFAWYRFLLKTGHCPDYTIEQDFQFLLRNNGAEDWLQACVGKCLGALEAANHRGDSAKRLFERAFKAIREEKMPGVKTLIRLTVAAEAIRSLGDEALPFQEAAKRILESFPHEIALHSLSAWKNYILNPNNPFPGMDYWY